MVDNETKVETNSTLLLENYLSFELENICKRTWVVIYSLSFSLFFLFFQLDTCLFFFHTFSFFLLHSHMLLFSNKNRETITRIWSNYLMDEKPNKHIFVVHS
jgi:hypothetical protein